MSHPHQRDDEYRTAQPSYVRTGLILGSTPDPRAAEYNARRVEREQLDALIGKRVVLAHRLPIHIAGTVRDISHGCNPTVAVRLDGNDYDTHLPATDLKVPWVLCRPKATTAEKRIGYFATRCPTRALCQSLGIPMPYDVQYHPDYWQGTLDSPWAAGQLDTCNIDLSIALPRSTIETLLSYSEASSNDDWAAIDKLREAYTA